MSRVPRIRFKGFEEDWEQRKVGSICLISTGKSNTQDRVEDGKYPFYVRSSIVERSNRYLFDEEAVLTVGDGVGTGKVFHYVNGKYDLHQRVYRMFCFEKDISAKYFFYYFSNNFYDRVMAMTAKTSVDSVRHEMIADMDIIVPYITEQKFIADIFQNFDHLITLHQRKLQKLKIIKKSMLENLFPQNGEKTPKIRFSGFTKDWEQRKLGEVFEEYSEKNHSELPTLTIIQGGGTIRRDESDRALQYDMNSLSNYKMVNKDDFIVHLRSFEGGLEKANSKGIISPAYHTFSGENTDTTFYYTYFRSEKFIESDLKPHVYGIRDGRSIDVEGMKSINIPYTIFEEQRHIGYLIDSINHLITLHQSKLEKLQKIKKSLLERMFV